MMLKSLWASPTVNEIARRVGPWLLMVFLLAWGWRATDLFHTIPAYGDVLEVIWGLNWYADHLADGQSAFFPLIFAPVGWHTVAFGYGLGTFLPWIPLVKFGGAVFAYNVASLLSFFIAFAGMYNLTRSQSGSPFAATLAALLFTFWGFRWLRINGHLNQAVGSALLPWMVWGLERGWRVPRRAWAWFVLVGVLWTMANLNNFYYIWIAGLLIVVWSGGRVLNRSLPFLQIASLGITFGVMILTTAPALWAYAQAMDMPNGAQYDIHQLNFYSASINSFPAPFLAHPFLSALAQTIYSAPPEESGVANFGIVTSLLALIGLWRARRDAREWPTLMLIVAGLTFATGLFLKWNRGLVQIGFLRPFNAWLWQVGYLLKPSFMTVPEALPPFDRAVPLPGLLAVILVPFMENARVLARYAFVASIGILGLVARQVERVTDARKRVLLALMLLIEIIPPPSGNFAYPLPSHAAFEWVREHTLPTQRIVDLAAVGDAARLVLRAETLAATQYHQRATLAGSGSVLPAHTKMLNEWLLAHPHPFTTSAAVALLRSYQADFILLHLYGADEYALLEQAQHHSEIELVQCFDPPADESPWAYPICVLRILPAVR